MGGTNAFVVLEEAPPSRASGESRLWQLLLLSAKTRPALEAAAGRLAEHMEQQREVPLADVAFTLQVGRKDLDNRLMFVCRDRAEAVSSLKALDPSRVATSLRRPVTRELTFLFPGQGSQSVNMGRELYKREAVFRDRVNLCSEFLRSHLGFDLREVLYPAEGETEGASRRLDQTSTTQAALFTVEYALSELWASWGVHPDAMIGHSLGEYVAACLAGVFSLTDALALVADRGQMMQQLPHGSMLAVPLSEDEVRPALGPGVALAAVNGASLCVLSGATSVIEDIEARLAGHRVKGRRLRTSHAFHSAMVDPILEEFTERVRRIGPRSPGYPSSRTSRARGSSRRRRRTRATGPGT